MAFALLRDVPRLGQWPDPIRWGRLYNFMFRHTVISSSMCSLFLSATPACLYLTRTHFSLITGKCPLLTGPLCLQDLPETPVAGVLLSGPSPVERATDVGVFRPMVFRKKVSR